MGEEYKLANVGIEQKLLGYALLNPADFFCGIHDMVGRADWHDDRNRQVFDAMMRLVDDGIPAPDMALVMQSLGDRWGPYLSELLGCSEVTAIWNARHYAKVISRLASLRRAVGVAQSIASLAYNSEDDQEVDELFDRFEGMLAQARPRGVVAAEAWLMLWADTFARYMSMQEDMVERLEAIKAGEAPQLATIPWAGVRRYVERVEPGEVALVAANPSVGKTVFMEDCAEAWARAGLNGLYFHLEISQKDMLHRRMCRHSGVQVWRLRNGYRGAEVVAVNRELAGWPGSIDYVHSPGWSADRIVRTTAKIRQGKRIDFVIVDYFQKMKHDGTQGYTRAQAAGQSMETLKNAAEGMGLAMLVGSQFSNASKERAIQIIDDARDTGELAEKCNIAWVLERKRATHRQVYQTTTGEEWVVETGARGPAMTCRTDKNTNGGTGATPLWLEAPRLTIRDVATQNLNEEPPAQGISDLNF